MKLQYNSPVVLTYALASSLVLIVSGGIVNIMPYFTVFPEMSLTNPIDYFRLFSHAFGHANWQHLLGNFTLILLLGPILEEKYGSKALLLMMLVTALITGVINVVFFPRPLLGASGVAFMLIVLSSVTNLKKGNIPITFLLIVFLFIGQEVFNSLKEDNVAQFAHIIGGAVGSAFGFLYSVNSSSSSSSGSGRVKRERKKEEGTFSGFDSWEDNPM